MQAHVSLLIIKKKFTGHNHQKLGSINQSRSPHLNPNYAPFRYNLNRQHSNLIFTDNGTLSWVIRIGLRMLPPQIGRSAHHSQ